MENLVKSNAINHGLYLGGLLVFLNVLIYAIDLSLITNSWYAIFTLLMIIVFGIISIVKAKELLGGFISFKQSFTSYFLSVLIGIVLSTVAYYLLFNFIDTEAGNIIKEQTIESTIKIMEGLNTPVEKIAEIVDKIEAENQFSISSIVKGLAYQLLFFSIIGLIVAAVMKKNPDNE